MKKIILILSVLFCAKANAQTYPPYYQNLGSPSTAVEDKGGLFVRGAFVPPQFVDTTAANAAPHTQFYAGSQINTTSDNLYWYRSNDLTQWIKMGSSSGGSGTDSLSFHSITQSTDSSSAKFNRPNGTGTVLKVVYDTTGGGSSGIKSVTGNIVNNADPLNPVINGISQTALNDTAAALRSALPITPSLGQVVNVGDTATKDIYINGLTIGRGGNNSSTNTVFGNTALGVNTTGAHNTAIGLNALKNNTTGSINTAIGSNALALNTTGGNNTAIGFSLANNKTGSNNVGIGMLNLNGADSSGSNNIAIGSNNIAQNANYNIAIGSNILTKDSAGYNIGIGASSMFSNTSGVRNVSIGDSSLYLNTTGNLNTALGDSAFYSGSSYSNSTAIGHGAQPTASNQVVLGNTSVTQTVINGVLLHNTAYTVSTLPTGVQGMTAYVTDAAATPTWGGTATGGGSIVAKVFYNGTTWIYE